MKLSITNALTFALGVASALGNGVQLSNGTPQDCIDATVKTVAREKLIEQAPIYCSVSPSTIESRKNCSDIKADIVAGEGPILESTKKCFSALETKTGADVKEVALENGITAQQYEEIMVTGKN
jgi:hypothetical protein